MEAEGLTELPPIIAAVIDNGEQPWDVQTQLSEMIAVPQVLRDSGFAFDRYVLVDKRGLYERGELPAGNLFESLITALHASDAGEFASSYDLTLERVFGSEAYEFVKEFILEIKGQGRHSELAEVVRQQEGETMVVRTTLADFEQQMLQRGIDQGWQQGLEQGMQQGMQQGRQQGREQGREQGMEQGMERGIQQGTQDSKREFARLLVGDGKSEQEVQRYTGLSIKEIRQLKRDWPRAEG